jgi:hypothetical protein
MDTSYLAHAWQTISSPGFDSSDEFERTREWNVSGYIPVMGDDGERAVAAYAAALRSKVAVSDRAPLFEVVFLR